MIASGDGFCQRVPGAQHPICLGPKPQDIIRDYYNPGHNHLLPVTITPTPPNAQRLWEQPPDVFCAEVLSEATKDDARVAACVQAKALSDMIKADLSREKMFKPPGDGVADCLLGKIRTNCQYLKSIWNQIGWACRRSGSTHEVSHVSPALVGEALGKQTSRGAKTCDDALRDFAASIVHPSSEADFDVKSLNFNHSGDPGELADIRGFAADRKRADDHYGDAVKDMDRTLDSVRVEAEVGTALVHHVEGGGDVDDLIEPYKGGAQTNVHLYAHLSGKPPDPNGPYARLIREVVEHGPDEEGGRGCRSGANSRRRQHCSRSKRPRPNSMIDAFALRQAIEGWMIPVRYFKNLRQVCAEIPKALESLTGWSCRRAFGGFRLRIAPKTVWPLVPVAAYQRLFRSCREAVKAALEPLAVSDTEEVTLTENYSVCLPKTNWPKEIGLLFRKFLVRVLTESAHHASFHHV